MFVLANFKNFTNFELFIEFFTTFIKMQKIDRIMDIPKRPIKKYGKPIAPILSHKRHFWENNESELAIRREISDIYTQQPFRENCKICVSELDVSNPLFVKMGVGYVLCDQCGHLNGVHQDTDEFATHLYTESRNKNENNHTASGEYLENDRDDYISRLNAVYIPKAKFLFEALQAENEVPTKFHYADLGAGSGYMITAFNKLGIKNVTGYESSREQVKFAKSMNDGISLNRVNLSEIYEIAANVDAEIVSMVGVLEHLRDPVGMMNALSENSNLKYVFLLIPMFSPSVFFEMSFPSVMPRVLTGGHTHLFNESSLDWICKEYGFERRSEWWFGQDIIDLMRSIEVTIREKSSEKQMTDIWNQMLIDAVDELQFVLDSKKLCSNVHTLLKCQ
jgi:hypothetical protein